MKKRLKLVLLTVMFTITLSGCLKNNSQNENIKTGEIKISEIEKEPERKFTYNTSNKQMEKLYSNPKNKELFLPKTFNFIDKNGLVYKRMNIPEYGISALIPEGFTTVKDKALYASKNGMVTIIGNTDKTKNIQISFFAKSDTEKNAEYVQKSFFNDIFKHYIHIQNNKMYFPVLLENGKLNNTFTEEDVYISNSLTDYIEMKEPISGLSVSKAKKLLKRTENPTLRLKTDDNGESTSPHIILNYTVVFNINVLEVTSYYGNNKDIALEIDNVVSSSIAYLDENQTDGFIGPTSKTDKIGDTKVFLPEGFEKLRTGDSSTIWINNKESSTMLVNPQYIFAYYQKTDKNNKDVLSSFSSFTGFKYTFKNKFGKENSEEISKVIGTHEVNKYYKNGISVSEGYYTNIQNSSDSGMYKAMYFEELGEIYVFMMNSNSFTNDIVMSTLDRMTTNIGFR